MSTTKYEVVFETFIERHFIKTFAKKYRGAWDITLSFLREEFRFFDSLLGKSIVETIIDSREIKICKTEFKIAGTPESRHSSGNRCIVAVHKNTSKVCVLLVYHKNDLGGGNETANWKKLIKENYSDYSSFF
ncbi:MAG: hypothetical protein NTV48_00520 [Candidatus Vogelbacteria bacterium]|nr:hypothetical protein [Candidatus Vogelbacteria bacterium]